MIKTNGCVLAFLCVRKVFIAAAFQSVECNTDIPYYQLGARSCAFKNLHHRSLNQLGYNADLPYYQLGTHSCVRKASLPRHKIVGIHFVVAHPYPILSSRILFVGVSVGVYCGWSYPSSRVCSWLGHGNQKVEGIVYPSRSWIDEEKRGAVQ